MLTLVQVVTQPESRNIHRLVAVLTTLGAVALALSISAVSAAQESSCAMGPLRLDSSTPRYFVNSCGRAVYLTGSHTHLSLKDGGNRPVEISPFDYEAYLDLMQANGHNFMRMWSGWELTMFEPQPWKRTGPGAARDGKPKFDLTQFDESYFERLRARVEAARERNIYVSVMLFEEWLLRFIDASAAQHPFDGANNVNGLDADRNGDGLMLEAHRLSDPAVTELQEAYLKKIVDTLNDLDNVLYEVANEPVFPDSVQWQYHVIAFIKKYQATKANQHPVGITSAGFSSPYDDLNELLDSDADWISPGRPLSLAYDFLENPPTVEIPKVIIADSDHLSKDLVDPAWVWKSLTRGVNPIYMDASPPLDSLNSADVTAMRKNLGYARMYADRMDLAASRPRPDLSSTGYVLAVPGVEYLVYQPANGGFSVNLAPGAYRYEWFDPRTGAVGGTGSMTSTGGNRTFSPPFDGAAVLHLGQGSDRAPQASRVQADPAERERGILSQ